MLITIKFLNNFFKSYKFEPISNYRGDYDKQWYQTGSFIVGYIARDIHNGNLPRFTIVYCGKKKHTVVSGIVSNNDRFIEFLKALVQPSLLALQLDQKWCKPLLSAYFSDN